MDGLEQEENGENKSNGDDLDNNIESDPLIYQLVRVEGDGTMVPATEDEVMQFEHLLDDDDKAIEDLANMELESFLSSEVKSEEVEQAFLPPENADLHIEIPNSPLEAEKPRTPPEHTPPPPPPPPPPQPEDISTHANETEKTEATSELLANDNAPPVPNFSLLQKDEICLDGLSIRELQEVFLATFGRLTNVKDKSWLKRRIAMGLTNSCEVPTSNFIIKNNKIVIIKEDEEIISQECKSSPSPSLDSNSKDSSSSKKRSSCTANSEEDVAGTGGTSTGMVKRMRKPTKRYIEELDLEKREMSRKNGNDRSGRTRVRIGPEMGPWGPALRTRSDSLGGFRVQVPFTSRTRRCRPRKNFVSLMKPQSGIFRDEDKTVIKEEEDQSETILIRKIKSPSLQIPINKPKVEEKEEEIEMQDEQEDEEEDTNSEDHEGIREEQNYGKKGSGGGGGGMRRKHHRAWTLCEVLKLVEGVSRYGAGRWSEIRRLVFASYSYRTSVDLKDKWRNLLRASSAQPSTEKEGKNARKPASMPIPKSILSRVRELAELQSQTGNEFPGCKSPGNKVAGVNGGGKVVQGKGSGFL